MCYILVNPLFKQVTRVLYFVIASDPMETGQWAAMIQHNWRQIDCRPKFHLELYIALEITPIACFCQHI